MSAARTRRWALVASGPVSCLLVFACTSPSAEEPSPVDSGDGAPGPSLPDASDSIAWEAAASDAGPPRRLDVHCDASPCYVEVSGSGSQHVCGLVRDGTVRCWGRDGALGRGRPVSVLEGATPAAVVGLSDVTQLSVGPAFGTCARKSDGSVYCWGRNEFGQLGRSPDDAVLLAPVRVEGLPAVDEVQLGSRTACAIASADRALYCWGQWINGLGVDAGDTSTLLPQVVTGFRPPIEALAIGSSSAYADDTIVVLLANHVLANVGGSPTGDSSLWTPFLPREVHGIARIGRFAYVTTDDRLVRWVPTTGTLNIPGGAKAVDVAISRSSTGLLQGAALLATGRLFRWGPNTAGALGVDPATLVSALYPVEVPQAEGRIVSFAITVGSTCVSLVDGTVECWGANDHGELGRGTVDKAAHPQGEVIQ